MPAEIVSKLGVTIDWDLWEATFTAGFHIDQSDRFCYAPLRFIPAHAHILGRAVIPN